MKKRRRRQVNFYSYRQKYTSNFKFFFYCTLRKRMEKERSKKGTDFFFLSKFFFIFLLFFFIIFYFFAVFFSCNLFFWSRRQGRKRIGIASWENCLQKSVLILESGQQKFSLASWLKDEIFWLNNKAIAVGFLCFFSFFFFFLIYNRWWFKNQEISKCCQHPISWDKQLSVTDILLMIKHQLWYPHHCGGLGASDLSFTSVTAPSVPDVDQKIIAIQLIPLCNIYSVLSIQLLVVCNGSWKMPV